MLDPRRTYYKVTYPDTQACISKDQINIPPTMPPLNNKTDVVDVLIIGAGQAGLAVSAHLRKHGIQHLLVERSDVVAERWRSERWDSLRQNGPCGHDCFPVIDFPPEVGGPDAFATKDEVAAYFGEFAKRIEAPVRFGVDIVGLTRSSNAGEGENGSSIFRAETAHGEVFTAKRVVVATGSFQIPAIPKVIPPSTPGLLQVHSSQYKNPAQLPPGAVLVVGAGSSGVQIADELLHAGRRVYLSVGQHQRPPRRYRGKDLTWWLQELGVWDAKSAGPAGSKHVSIAVSGVNGAKTIDYREFASRGMVLVGHLESFEEDVSGGKKVVRFAPDLRENIESGDRGYFAILRQADEYVARHGLDMPEDPDAHRLSPSFAPDPPCLTQPQLALDLAEAGVASVVWATGYARDFGWVQVEGAVEGATGRPVHQEGVSCVPGLYFVGLPFLRNRASSFIFGAWKDAGWIAQRIAQDYAAGAQGRNDVQGHHA